MMQSILGIEISEFDKSVFDDSTGWFWLQEKVLVITPLLVVI